MGRQLGLTAQRQPERAGEGCGYNQGHMQKKRGPARDTRYHYWGLCWEGAGSLQKLLSLLHALRQQDRSSQGEREPRLPQCVPEVGASHPHRRENQERVPITVPCHGTRKHAQTAAAAERHTSSSQSLSLLVWPPGVHASPYICTSPVKGITARAC